RDARARPPFTVAQEFRDRKVGVGREHDLANRQADMARPQASERIAQIPGRYDEVRAPAGFAPQLQPGLRVVSHLRQEPPDVDAVGGGELMRFGERRVAERFLHHALTIVEGAAYG